MADFLPAFHRTLGHEGAGESNDPIDRGGRTYRGISQVHHPDWPGWTCPRGERDEHVEALYRSQFWSYIRGDNIADQPIAEELFDTAVNTGIRAASRMFQRALNILNRQGRVFADLAVDGRIGSATIAALDSLPSRDMATLLKLLNILQGMHYVQLMERDETQERFARGWLART